MESDCPHEKYQAVSEGQENVYSLILCPVNALATALPSQWKMHLCPLTLIWLPAIQQLEIAAENEEWKLLVKGVPDEKCVVRRPSQRIVRRVSCRTNKCHAQLVQPAGLLIKGQPMAGLQNSIKLTQGTETTLTCEIITGLEADPENGGREVPSPQKYPLRLHKTPVEGELLTNWEQKDMGDCVTDLDECGPTVHC